MLILSAYITSYDKEISVKDNSRFEGGEIAVMTDYFYATASGDGNPYTFDTAFQYNLDSLELSDRDIIEVSYNLVEWTNVDDTAIHILDGDSNYYGGLEAYGGKSFYSGKIVRDFVDNTGNYTQIFSNQNGGTQTFESNENNVVEASWTDDWTLEIHIKGSKANVNATMVYASFFNIKIYRQ